MPLTRSKAAKVKQTTRAPAPHLPDELWHRIAGFLSTKDWVGASGSCRHLRQLQLEHLNITATSAHGSISALLWLAKQLPGARSLVLGGWIVKSALQQEVADKVRIAMQPALQSPEALSKLSILRVQLGPSDDERAKRMNSTGDLPHMGICLGPILAKATRLSKLELACVSAAGLPPLANLRHMALHLFRFPMSDRISTLLQNMPSLETLQLSHSSASHDSYGDHVEAMLVVPASVQRVELVNVFPESLVLNSDRTVVRLIGAVCCLEEALMGWPDVRGQLKGLRLYQRADEIPYSVDPMDESHLWDHVEVLQFMRAPASPVDVELHGLPVASLGNLTSLHVTMANLCITIPALPGLKDLRLDCARTLCMSFEDARVCAENLVGFEFVFAVICVDDTISAFFATLVTAGKPCAVQQDAEAPRES
ncbi:g1608 [Coccomyxa elongata]